MAGPSYVRMYPTDWRSGCMGLSLEQEGLYIRMCMFIAETGRRVPLDDTEASRMMATQTRNYRRVIGELLRLGKIKRHNDGYGNDRIEFERSRAQAGSKQTGNSEHPATSEGGTDREADQGQEREDHAVPVAVKSDLTPIYSRYNSVITELAGEKDQQNQTPFIEPEPETRKKEQDTPLPPKGGLVSQQADQIDDGKQNPHVEALKAFTAYNDRALVLGLPQASKLTPDRKRRINARLKDFGLDGWTTALANLDTPFLRGLTEHRFRADLDFVCQAKSFSKLHDGGYAPAQGTPNAADRNRPTRHLSKSERLQAAVDRAMYDNVTVFAARSSWKTADDGDAHAVFSGAEIVRA